MRVEPEDERQAKEQLPVGSSSSSSSHHHRHHPHHWTAEQDKAPPIAVFIDSCAPFIERFFLLFSFQFCWHVNSDAGTLSDTVLFFPLFPVMSLISL